MRSPRTATKSSPRLPQLEKTRVQQWRPNAAKTKQIKKKKRTLANIPVGKGIPRAQILDSNIILQ